MKRLFFLLFLCLTLNGFSQGTYKTDFMVKNYGDVKEWKNDTTWFYLTNTSNAHWFVLPTFYHQEFQVLSPKRKVMPNERIKIGVVYYTENKGRFSIDVPVYLSSEQEEISFKVKGKISSFHPEALVHCPNLDPKDSRKDSLFFIPFPQSPKDKTVYIVSKKDSISSKKEDDIVEEDIVEYYWEKDIEKDAQDTVKIITDSIPEPFVDSVLLDTSNSEIIPKPIFGQEYATNNLVFLIDVSGSMRYDEKLENLKLAMKELILALRPEDKISIITYASRATVIYEPSAHASKKDLLEIVDSLTANGSSYGKEGLKMAYHLAKQSYIKEGNNSILLATDGLFNYSGFMPGKLYRQARVERIKGVKLSTLGFGKDKESLKFLNKLANAGGGEFLKHNKEKGDLPLIALIQKMSKLP